MKQVKHYLSLFILLAIGVLAAKAQTIDAQASHVHFEISNMAFRTVEGTISGMKGSVLFDEENPEATEFNVCVDPATVDTESDKRDEHLRNEDFFNVNKYPSICFISQMVIKTKDGFLTKGELTLHGSTKEVSIPFTSTISGSKQTLTGKIEINRFDYGLAAASYDGTFMVGETAELVIECVLNREKTKVID